ncbi:hypothetical protein [Luteibacter sp. UNCMF331Sha3.1]|uniref:hypothetical protein n=1 Tax=Luteibacter sp. UNCMF331Sha3.1 TaxID=1502760 RepID=UPI00147F2D18|nr:hypothetical protein [Luteibacter sp. UNCMF331Sha3.1]
MLVPLQGQALIGMGKAALARIFCIAILLPFTAMAGESSPDLWSRVSSIRMAHTPVADKSAAFRRVFAESFAPRLENLIEVGDDELRRTFKVLGIMNFFAQTGDYEGRPLYLGAMGRALDEMSRRGSIADSEIDAYHEGLVVMRRFAAADILRKRYKGHDFADLTGFDATPDIDTSSPAGYSLSESGELRLSNVALPASGDYVVIVIGCHFAEDAARSIAGNGAVLKALSGMRTVWLMSGAELDKEVLLDWNRQFPMFPATIAYDNRTWSGVDFTRMPTIHVFKSGTLAHSFSGWGDDSASDLLAAMKPSKRVR